MCACVCMFVLGGERERGTLSELSLLARARLRRRGTGPMTTWVFHYVNYSYGYIAFNALTVPGYASILLLFVFVLFVVLFFESPPQKTVFAGCRGRTRALSSQAPGGGGRIPPRPAPWRCRCCRRPRHRRVPAAVMVGVVVPRAGLGARPRRCRGLAPVSAAGLGPWWLVHALAEATVRRGCGRR